MESLRLKIWAAISLLALRPETAQTESQARLTLVGYLRPVASLRVTRLPASTPHSRSEIEIETRGEPYKVTIERLGHRRAPTRAWFNGRILKLRDQALPVFASPVAQGTVIRHRLRASAGSPPLRVTLIQN